MANTVEGLAEVYKDHSRQLLLVLVLFSGIGAMLCHNPHCFLS